ncbi:MAG: hypothetical protein HC905_25535 [Bacteroidales bacterium]|nr:hypothetical protein [Bacteroidales bacterium]
MSVLPLVFYTLYFWLKHKNSRKLSFYLALCILLTLNYFAGILTYAFLGLTIGLYILYFELRKFHKTKEALRVRALTRPLVTLFIVSLPGNIFAAIFFSTTAFITSTDTYSISELIKWLNDVRPLIVFDYPGDKLITEQFLHIIIVTMAIALYLRFKNRNMKGIFLQSDVILIPALTALFLFL